VLEIANREGKKTNDVVRSKGTKLDLGSSSSNICPGTDEGGVFGTPNRDSASVCLAAEGF
jgi:hypothetical protein